jgi:hypothetical protein
MVILIFLPTLWRIKLGMEGWCYINGRGMLRNIGEIQKEIMEIAGQEMKIFQAVGQ